MNIKQAIINWDGKSVDDIRAIYARCKEQSDCIQIMIELIQDPSCQIGASWLLKAWLESKNKLEASQIKTIYGLLNKLEHWETKLHLLQSLPLMPIGQADRGKVEAFLRANLIDTNKFVRAWSYNGFYVLATQYPAYVPEVKQFFEMAMRDEAASVKARIRNIMKKGFK